MSGLNNTFKRIMSFSKGSGYETHTESDIRRGGPEKREQKRLDEMFASGQVPDEDLLKLAARRRAARRRGSRADTILTDTLG